MSLVWFDFVAPDGTELVSSYIARDGEVLASSCGDMTVRPMGQDVVFPPTPGSPMPSGFMIDAKVQGEGTLRVNVTHRQIVSEDAGTSWRWIGEVSGGFGNGTTWDGVALYEQFNFNN